MRTKAHQARQEREVRDNVRVNVRDSAQPGHGQGPTRNCRAALSSWLEPFRTKLQVLPPPALSRQLQVMRYGVSYFLIPSSLQVTTTSLARRHLYVPPGIRHDYSRVLEVLLAAVAGSKVQSKSILVRGPSPVSATSPPCCALHATKTQNAAASKFLLARSDACFFGSRHS